MLPTSLVAFTLLATTSLFTVVNPVSAAPLFVALTARFPVRERRRIARRACIAAFFVLLGFGAAGTLVFRLFGITPEAFRIAGGILFLVMSMGVLLGRKEIGSEDEHANDPSLVPLAIPLLSGPGAITTVVVLGAQAPTSGGKGLVGLAILVVISATYGILAAAPRIIDRVGPEVRRAAEKLLALLTGVIGVQFVIDGVRAVALGLVAASH